MRDSSNRTISQDLAIHLYWLKTGNSSKVKLRIRIHKIQQKIQGIYALSNYGSCGS